MQHFCEQIDQRSRKRGRLGDKEGQQSTGAPDIGGNGVFTTGGNERRRIRSDKMSAVNNGSKAEINQATVSLRVQQNVLGAEVAVREATRLIEILQRRD
jgi:hypothetical protein